MPADEGGSVQGLDFDSGIFGAQVGRLELASADEVSGAVASARSAGFDHVSVRVDPDASKLIWALEDSGFRLVDVAVVFVHALRDLGTPTPSTATIREATDEDVELLVERCATIFRGSRYYADPFFSEAGADEVHRRWIRNCHAGRAEVVLAAVEAGEGAAGFVTCGIDAEGDGVIELLGVAPTFAGRGIARGLVDAAVAWFAERVKKVHVKTQAVNYAAAAVYVGAGFKLSRTELTFGLDLRRETT